MTPSVEPTHAHPGIVLPAPSQASRRIATKSRRSVRGFVVATFPAEPHGRRIFFESGLERDFILLMLARPDVTGIVEQPFTLPWSDGSGRRVRYTPDFLLILTNGSRLIVEIKRAERASRTQLKVTLAAIAQQLPSALADGIMLFTDAHYQAWEAVNAAQLHEARKGADREADEALAAAANTLRGNLTVRDLAALLGLDNRGFPAVLRGLALGGLRLVTPGIIEPSSLVAARGAS